MRQFGAQSAAHSSDARTLDETAKRVAVSKAGARVCREMKVGISERDWIRGKVIEVGPKSIRVEIYDAGRFPQTLGATELKNGVSIWDNPANWTPCS